MLYINIIVNRVIRTIIKVDDDVWFVGAVVSDLERRNRDVDEERSGIERIVGGVKFIFVVKKVVDDGWIGLGRIMILMSLDR